MTVKSRKQGTSIVVTIPAEFHVAPNVEYTPKMLPDGTVQFTPISHKYPEIWKDDPKDIQAFNDSLGSYDDGGSYGREATEY